MTNAGRADGSWKPTGHGCDLLQAYHLGQTVGAEGLQWSAPAWKP